jgi:hypothetical protein
MVSAWAKKVVDPAPLCGKSAKIMRLKGWRMELYCANQDGPFPVKGYFASICIREGAFSERMRVVLQHGSAC